MKTHRVLIVDDKEENRYLLRSLLQGNGYEVVAAHNGAEALESARKNPPDLIISDILMPVMDGFTLCRECKKDERLKGLPFVFYTATYTDERDRAFALSLGAEKFLVKPVEPEVFVRTIREVLEQVRRAPAPIRPSETLRQEEAGYLKQYNEVLIRKLEAKMEQLEQANREMERDIAERKKAEAELRTAYEFLQKTQTQLMQSEKMASVGFLTASIAHEIDIPASNILANLSALQKWAENLESFSRETSRLFAAPEEKKKYAELERRLDVPAALADIPKLIKEMREGAERIKQILRDLSLLSRRSDNGAS